MAPRRPRPASRTTPSWTRSAPRSPPPACCRPRSSRSSARWRRPPARRSAGCAPRVSIAADELGLRPLIDLAPDERADQGLRVAAVIPTIVAALHRVSLGHDPVDGGTRADADGRLPPRRDRGDAHGRRGPRPRAVPDPDDRPRLQRVDVHGRVVASTGADMADVVGAALGALAGPLHGGAPSRALDALDAIGDPARTEAWVEGEVAAGRRIMGFGHAVYRTQRPALGAAARGRRRDSAATSSTRPSTSRPASSPRCGASSPTARCRATSSSSPAS